MKRWSKSLMAVALVGAATVALAQRSGGGRDRQGGASCPMMGGGPGLEKMMRMEPMLRKAGATDEQLAALKEKAYELRKQMITLHAEQEQSENELQHLLGQDKVDRAAVMKAVEQVGAVKTNIQKLRVQQQLDMRDLLGAEVMGKLRAVSPEGCRMGPREGKSSWGKEMRGQENRDEGGWRRERFGKGPRSERRGEEEDMPEPGAMPEPDAPPAE